MARLSDSVTSDAIKTFLVKTKKQFIYIKIRYTKKQLKLETTNNLGLNLIGMDLN